MKKLNVKIYHRKNLEEPTSENIYQLNYNSEPSLSAVNIAVEPKFQIR